MTQTPFFSVIIPTHNRADLLDQAIASVLQQTFANFELIVIDDHSTDDTQARLAGYDDPRLTYFLNDQSRGGAGARNAGIARAQGEWIAFLDDDDVWLSHKLARQYDKITAVSPEVGLIYAGYATYDFQRARVISEVMPEKEGWILPDLLYRNYVKTFSGVVIRADLLRQVGGLDHRFPALQDIDLYIRLAQQAAIAYVPEILVWLRKGHGDRISTDWTAKLVGFELLIQKYTSLLDQFPRAHYQMHARLFVYTLLAGQLKKLSHFETGQLIQITLDWRNWLWLLRELGSHWLNRWRVWYYNKRRQHAPLDSTKTDLPFL